MLPVGLSTYSFNVMMGYRQAESGIDGKPWSIEDFVGQAVAWGFSSVELPVRAFTSIEHAQQMAQYLAAHHLGVVADTGIATSEAITAALPIAQALGASILRVTLSNILCGERRELNGGWRAYLETMAEQLRIAAPRCADAGIAIAIENHQDVDSVELLWLCDYVGSESCGVCLDIANPLAVGEDVVSFTQRIGAYLRNVHLKDYRLFSSPQGYRLARCPLGDGVLDWPRLFSLLEAIAPNCPKHVELGAVQARHIQLFEESWWNDYEPRLTTSLLPILRLREERGQPADADWRTPHERGEPSEVCRNFELAEMERSIAYLQSLFSQKG